MYKIIGSDQKIYGPVSVEQIRRWQAEGRVNNATLLLADGSSDWRPLSSFPEFGVPPVVTMTPPVAARRDNGLALAGLICGVASNVCCCFGVVCAVAGIILSAIALSRHEANPQQGNKGMALAGLILSAVGLAWHCLLPLSMGFQPGVWRVFHHRWRQW
jgi:hypothetical protein